MNYRPTNIKKALQQPTHKTRLLSQIVASCLLLSGISAHAATTIVTPDTGSTTVIEQHPDGNVTTITSNQNGISMKNGMPYAVTQIQTTPRTIVRSVTVNTNAPVITQTTQPVVATQVISTPVITNSPVLLSSVQVVPSFSKPGVVNTDTKIVKITQDGAGNEVAAPASNLQTGDIIEYHITYTNASARPLRDIVATISLPNSVRLLSLQSPLQTLATTGANSNYQVISPVGNTAILQITDSTPLDTYTGLQWKLSNIAPNASKTVIVRAQVQ